MKCRRCGACCARQGSPPFGYMSELPLGFQAAIAVMSEKQPDRYDRGLPCYFYDVKRRRCAIYEYRPEICRKFRPGSKGCKKWRDGLSAPRRMT